MPLKQNENENSTVGNKFNYDDVPIGGRNLIFLNSQVKNQKKSRNL